METKKDIRKRILNKRNALSIEKWQEMSLLIQKKVLLSEYFVNQDWIFAYISCKSEVDTDYLLKQCFILHKKVACPKVLSDGEMDFFQIRGREDLAVGYKGILEPTGDIVCRPKRALVLVPGCAFDRNAYRIGYGKGFYDRYLSKRPHYQTMGLAFSCQIVEDARHEAHDVPLQHIVTEKEMIQKRI